MKFLESSRQALDSFRTIVTTPVSRLDTDGGVRSHGERISVRRQQRAFARGTLVARLSRPFGHTIPAATTYLCQTHERVRPLIMDARQGFRVHKTQLKRLDCGCVCIPHKYQHLYIFGDGIMAVTVPPRRTITLGTAAFDILAVASREVCRHFTNRDWPDESVNQPRRETVR